MSNELISRLRRRVVVLQPQRTSDGAGGYSVSWEEVGSYWAEVLYQFSDGQFDAMQWQSGQQVKVRMRDRVNVDIGMRLQFSRSQCLRLPTIGGIE